MKRRRAWPGEHKCETAKQRRLGQECSNSDGSSMPSYAAVMPPIHHSGGRFIHKPLNDNKNEIRLLQMLQGGDDNEDCLRFSIRTENFHQVADFIAISYTWGAKTSQRSVLIDAEEYPIRQNCHYVLKQTYLHWKQGMLQSDLLWIDSICINQYDNAEKNSQVSIMGEIYSKAGLVLASVGPHANDSEFFVEKAWDVADFKYDCTHAEFLCQDCVLPWEGWALTLGIECLSRLCRACDMFGGREYWTRVWIIQEIAKATSLRILCGNDMLPWTAIHSLEDFLSIEIDEIESMFDRYGRLPTVESNQMHDVFIAKKKRVPIDEVFSQFSRFNCGNLRDRLYGLLSLIEWPQHAGPILPDYGASIFDVAVQVEPYIATQQIPQMLAALRITSKDEHVQRLIGQRREKIGSEDFDSAVSAVREFKAMHASDQKGEAIRALCGWIELAENGDMTATLVKRVSRGYKMPFSPSEVINSSENLSEDDPDSEERRDSASDMASFLLSTSSEWGPRVVMFRSEVAGFVCPDAREGDVLVPLLDPESEVYLVLRQNHEEVYDIIGQGVFQPGYQFGCEPGAYDDLAEVALFEAQIELKIAAEDAILLFAQDRVDLDVDGLPLGDSDPDDSDPDDSDPTDSDPDDSNPDDSDPDDSDPDDLDDSRNQKDHWGRVLTSVGGMLSGAARITMQTQMLAKDVVMRDKPFDPREAYLMREKVRDACSGVVGQSSKWVVGRDSRALNGSQEPPAVNAAQPG